MLDGPVLLTINQLVTQSTKLASSIFCFKFIPKYEAF